MKRIISIVLLLAVIGGAVGFYMYNKPRGNLKKAKADFTLTADELFDQYTADIPKGDETFLGKIIQVSGNLEEVAEKENGKVSLILTAEGAPVGGINAELDERFTSAEGLEAGQDVVLKGECTGLLEMDLFQDVILKSCLVVD